MSVDIIQNLKNAVLEYDREAATKWAGAAVEQKIDPARALDAMTSAVRQIGDGFGKGELFLPDLVGAADAMLGATPILEEDMRKRGSKHDSLGQVVIGTVFGDIHTIGKTMVSVMLACEGFSVHDLGINITANQFMDAIKQYEPDILAMSALLTSTALEQKKVIEMLKQEGLRDKVKVIIGGGAITKEFADSIGADGYEATAPGAAILARKLVGK